MHDIAHYLRPGHLAQLRKILDDPEASRQRPVRRARPAQERQHRRRRRAADVPGHRHRDRDGQEGRAACSPAPTTARRSAAGVYDAYTRLNLRYSQLAPLTMFEEKNTGTNLPAQIELYSTPARATGVQVPVHGQGRRLGQQVVPLPGDQGAAQPDAAAGVPRREDPLARHRRLPAVPPRRRHRRHVAPSSRSRPPSYASAHYLDDLPDRGLDERATASATSSWRRRSSS